MSKTNFLKSILRRLSILINMIGTIVIGYFGYRAIGTAIAANSLTQRVQLNFIWGSYDPVIFMVMEDVVFFFIFYKKFYPKNIYLFMALWGLSDLAFNAVYDVYHLPQLLSDPQVWQIGASWASYFKVMGIEGIIGIIGIILLRPKHNLTKENFGAITVGLSLLIMGYLYSFATGYNVISDPAYVNSMSLYTLNFIENTGLLMFVYSSIRPSEGKFK